MVNTAIQDLNRTYLEYERKVHQLRKLRFMKTRASAPKPYQRVLSGGLRSPLSYRLVQTVVGMITKDRPSYKRLPLDNDDKPRAARLAAAADPLMQDLERIAHKPLYEQFVDAVVADGRGIMKCYRDVWQGFPSKESDEEDKAYNKRVAEFVMRGACHPLRMRLVDNLNFKVPLVDYEPPYVLEQGKRPTVDVANTFGLRIGVNNRVTLLPQETAFHRLELPTGIAPVVDVEELWMDDYKYVRMMGQVYKQENELGFKPYVWTAGETSSHPDPSLSNLSILYPYAGIEPWLNTMLSVLAAWGVIGGTPILYTSRKLPPGMGAMPDTMPQLSDIPLGKRIDLGVGGEIGFVQPPPVGREVLEFIQFLTDFLDRAGLPGMAYGNIGTRTPGTAFQGALEQAIAKVNPVTEATERAMAEIVKMHWRMVESIGMPVVVTGLGVRPSNLVRRRSLGRFVVDPKDINGYYDLHAKIRVGNTQDLISRGMHAAFMKAHKLWSRDRAMEFADVDDPNREYQDIMRDTLEESPLVQQLILQQALEQEPELAQRAAQLQGQGIDIGALLTGIPSGGAPGTAGVPNTPPGAGTTGSPTAGGVPTTGGIGGGQGTAPRRGGKPSGSPKNPGGPRQNRAGTRGHS